MDKNKITRTSSSKRVVPISIKISNEMSKWLRANNYSPTAVFLEACKDLGFKE